MLLTREFIVFKMKLMQVEKRNFITLEKFALGQGFSFFGVADITASRKDFNIDPKIAVKYSRGISLGKKLLNSVLDTLKDHPNALYFHHYRQVNFFLDRGAFLVASFIQDLGFNALPIAASQIIDWEKQIAHVSHKKVAQLAGLGWIGRNNLLVNSESGSRFRLVTVLTDMPLECGEPLPFSCGDCTKCVSVCPAGAIEEDPENFNHIACFEKLKEFRKRGLVGQYICGVCVRECSGFNRLS